ncbi:TetR/AcrR family transcriptional regulator [Achromobacter ruhlandii]|uniref:TetR/AcrR family transcriptional regulator n=1 Tax=Achromobacter ruhlandii TaxID=72557 RepID=UPI000665C729|nr:TetR/AcrR family transcriptional regulator [Achromobacter ruhlandii]MCZ8434849.1 TetR/AcrR family transcriptional regulator [Achromobacter ruhlandii]MDC6092013.1 TetR/AcrR family transcriptional regulator [Achromobacter ruhlandii]MDC6149004.1 TetR/AcrR family transcriptional regulator [Achromobacter ruhlandii]MDD7982449.1 TetR/AcrR family transcriptional regulator [Achromobacter ruhlandii]WIW05832.1 TetR/AcrR family transcriptional regulator [Achromobacter ruhlandii]
MIAPASRQAAASGEPPHGPRARMRKILLDAAQRLMAQGLTPSVAELAEHAQVSRATAYRYFPSQSALIAAVVDESLGPILAWDSTAPDAATRVDELLRFAYPRLQAHEASLRAAIQVSLQQHAEASAGRAGNQPRLVRGHRIDILKRAIAPLAGTLTPAQQDRVAQALSLVYGTEVFLVLKDIWGLDQTEVTEVARWTATAIIRQALADAAATPAADPRKR